MLKVILSFFVFFNAALVCFADDFTLDLKQGRNFISLPLSLSNPSLSEAFSSISGKYTNVWLYNSSIPADHWKHYHPGYITFSDPISIEPGSAYWLETTEDCSLTVSGTPASNSFSLNLKSGWNAFGWPYLQSQPIETALGSLTFGTDYSRLCRFDSQVKTFEDYFSNSALDQFDTFQAGGAYYIYILREQTIEFLPSSQTLSISLSSGAWSIGEMGVGVVVTMEDADKIVVANDGNGKQSYSLSVTDPANWSVQSQPGTEAYVLNAAFSGDPANINWNETDYLVITAPVTSTETRFAGDENGIDVLSGETRNLFLQFKSPTQTQVVDRQSIILTISAEIPAG